MRVLIQRVKAAQVRVKGEVINKINKGLLLFVGVGKEDNFKDAEILSKKIAALRIFPDEQGKMNLNILQAAGEILSVSQFTLYADTKKGNRPGFDSAADPVYAQGLWREFNGLLKKCNVPLREGIFAADMEVELINDGPVTIWLDSREK